MKAPALMFLALLLCASLPAQNASLAPLPAKIVAARTVFLMNDTGKSRLGDGIYKQIKTWNRWQVVNDRDKADLILSLTDKSGVASLNPSWYLNVIDPGSHDTIWTSRTTMQGKLWRGWGSVAQSLLKDIEKRLDDQK